MKPCQKSIALVSFLVALFLMAYSSCLAEKDSVIVNTLVEILEKPVDISLIKYIDTADISLSRNSEKYFIRGFLRFVNGRNKEAINDFNIAIRLNPNFSYAYDFRGRAKYNINEYNDAAEDLEDACRMDTLNQYSIYMLSLSYYQLRKFDLATKYANISLKKDSTKLYYYFTKTMIYNFEGKYDSAVAVIDKYLEFDSTDETALILKARTLNNSGNKEFASQIIERISGNVKDKKFVFYELAQYYYDTNNQIMAWETINKCINEDSTDIRPRKERIKILLMNRQYQEALNDVDYCLSRIIYDKNLIQYKAQICIYLKQYDIAKDIIDRELNQYPNDVLLYYQLIFYYYSIKNCKEIDNTYKRILQIDPDNLEAKVHFILEGERKESQRFKIKECLKQMEERIEDGNNSVFYYLNYGKLCFFAKKYKKALVMFDRAIQEFPADPDFYTQRSLCRMVLGLAGACDDLRRAKELGATDVDNLIKENCSK